MTRTLGAVRRRGFTVLECVVALAILALALTLVAEVAVWSLRERRRTAQREAALEAAVNLLESARARPWSGLTPEWAQAQRLPEELAQQLPEGRLTVQVEKEAAWPHTKRVTVEIQWQPEDSGPPRPVRLVSLFSARATEGKGGTP